MGGDARKACPEGESMSRDYAAALADAIAEAIERQGDVILGPTDAAYLVAMLRGEEPLAPPIEPEAA